MKVEIDSSRKRLRRSGHVVQGGGPQALSARLAQTASTSWRPYLCSGTRSMRPRHLPVTGTLIATRSAHFQPQTKVCAPANGRPSRRYISTAYIKTVELRAPQMDVRILDTTFRDGAQSLWAMAIRHGMMEPVAADMDNAGLRGHRSAGESDPLQEVHSRPEGKSLRPDANAGPEDAPDAEVGDGRRAQPQSLRHADAAGARQAVPEDPVRYRRAHAGPDDLQHGRSVDASAADSGSVPERGRLQAGVGDLVLDLATPHGRALRRENPRGRRAETRRDLPERSGRPADGRPSRAP